jgi:hypothetical protein
VHALDTVERTAVCVDLPMETPPDHVANARLVVGPGGETITVDSPSGGTVAVVDTRTLSLRPEPTEQPAARAAAPPPPAEQHAEAPAWLPWAVLAGALALIAVAFGARRIRRRVSPGTGDATPGRDRPGLAPALSERTRPHHLDAGVNGARKVTARVL